MATVWSQYHDTLLTLSSAQGLVVDLRQAVTIELAAAFRAIVVGISFGIVTACDPMGIYQNPAVNRVRTDMLQKEIESTFLSHALVGACSVDGSHCEASFALAADLASITALATRYDQLGIFWFDGNSFWIIPARSTNAPLRLPIPPD